MQSNESFFMNVPVMNNPQASQIQSPQTNQQVPPQQMNPPPYSQPEMNDLMKYRMVYPEIYYKLQPFVMLACDQMDTYSSEMPTQEMVEQMSDNIFEDVCRMYPDMADYVKCAEKAASADIPTQGILDYDRDRYGRHFRRRGLFRDFIDILLLSELFRRRRRYY